MKKSIILLSMVLLFMTSCMQNMGHPMGYGPMGAIYTGTKQGMSGQPGGSKTAEACNLNILNWFTFNSVSPKDAMRNSGITQVTHVDKTTFWILIFGKSCTVIHGN